MYIKALFIVLICLFNSAVSFSQSVSFDAIYFTKDGTENGTPLMPDFKMNSCWGALGYHHSGNVYMAISDHQVPGNVAIFKYNPSQNKMILIGDLKSASLAAGNWIAGESQQKIHTQIFEHSDGKMYCATHDNSWGAITDHRGSKIFTIDENDNLTDYNATSTYYIDASLNTIKGNIGVAIQHYGIITMGVNPRVPDLIYGITYNDGYLLALDLSTGVIRKLIKTSNSSKDYISRQVAVDNNGNAYVAIGIGSNTKQVYKYTYKTDIWSSVGDPFIDNNSSAKSGGFACQVYTPSADTLYAFAFNGDVYRLIFESARLDKLGNIGKSDPAVRNIILSKDGKSLYYLSYQYSPDTDKFELREFSLVTNTYSVVQNNLIDFYGKRDLFYGNHTVDNEGNAYLVSWTFEKENIALMKMHFGTDYIAPNPLPNLWEGTGIDEISSIEPGSLPSIQNHPNPFNLTTNFNFKVPVSGFVSLKIYDVFGNQVAEVISEKMTEGDYTRQWDVPGLPDGIYFSRLQIFTHESKSRILTDTNKLILLR